MAVGHRGAAPAGWPSPRGLPLLGSTLDLTRDLLGTFHRAMLEHGDVVRFVIGPPGLRTSVYAFFQCAQTARAQKRTEGGGEGGEPERQACVSQPVEVRPGETPGSPVARLPAAGGSPLVEAERWQLTGP
ncbi:MAG: hypothetical protein ACRDJO_11140 [Actinomycetota bacterium]